MSKAIRVKIGFFFFPSIICFHMYFQLTAIQCYPHNLVSYMWIQREDSNQTFPSKYFSIVTSPLTQRAAALVQGAEIQSFTASWKDQPEIWPTCNYTGKDVSKGFPLFFHSVSRNTQDGKEQRWTSTWWSSAGKLEGYRLSSPTAFKTVIKISPNSLCYHLFWNPHAPNSRINRLPLLHFRCSCWLKLVELPNCSFDFRWRLHLTLAEQ